MYYNILLNTISFSKHPPSFESFMEASYINNYFAYQLETKKKK